ncbi:hypothetical protein BOX15_Mlig008638g3 [Macrostomum lignano]|uniref:Uncharacterized protein n=1 Tax=Macrostomum lignano TaxID=282301 RepID=A0A267GQN8_9PLAT|nr:hypothetical protein BOX15_Mlig008638g2 [Macrostomum lignano]PAA71733.1 hypothetical protein BOX15_Mlig008638g1 [Macrostomum lignano]PAA88323.1 hypothetical protein BOX15_Mlig008638g3 [Macrostomum lignano]
MDDDQPCEEEQKLMEEIKEMKAKIKVARKEVADADYVTATENQQPLGRLKFKVRKELHGHLAKLTDLQWGNESTNLITAGQDGKIFLWDAFSCAKLNAIFLKTAWVMSCRFNPDNTRVASGGLDNLLSIHNLDDTEAEPVELTGHDGYLACIRFTDAKHCVTSSGDKTCAFWDLETGKIVHRFEGHDNDVNALALADSHRHFVSASSDHTAKLWDLRERHCRATYEGHEMDVNGVDYFPQCDYAFATSSDDGSCRMWDIRADQMLANFSDEFIQCGSTCLSVSRSGRLLIAGYDDYNCHVWDTLLEERVGIMLGHDNRISCLGISPSGLAVATGAWDNNSFIWTAK